MRFAHVCGRLGRIVRKVQYPGSLHAHEADRERCFKSSKAEGHT